MPLLGGVLSSDTGVQEQVTIELEHPDKKESNPE